MIVLYIIVAHAIVGHTSQSPRSSYFYPPPPVNHINYFIVSIYTHISFLLLGKSFGYRKAFADFFVLQIEGNSQWKISTNTTADSNTSDSNINDSSSNSNSNNTDDNDNSSSNSSSLDIHLLQGDFLYIPKHSTFQASYSSSTQCDTHSLYLIIYINEFDNYTKMLEMILPLALEQTMALRHQQQQPQILPQLQQQSLLLKQQNKNNKNTSSNSSNSSAISKISQQHFPPRILPPQSFSFLGVAHSELENEVEDAMDAEEVEANESIVDDMNKSTTKQKSISATISSAVVNDGDDGGDDDQNNSDDNDNEDDDDDDDEEQKNILLAVSINANRKRHVEHLLYNRESFLHDLQRHLNLISAAAVGLTDAATDQVN